jgi:hypothetical protein
LRTGRVGPLLPVETQVLDMHFFHSFFPFWVLSSNQQHHPENRSAEECEVRRRTRPDLQQETLLFISFALRTLLNPSEGSTTMAPRRQTSHPLSFYAQNSRPRRPGQAWCPPAIGFGRMQQKSPQKHFPVLHPSCECGAVVHAEDEDFALTAGSHSPCPVRRALKPWLHPPITW